MLNVVWYNTFCSLVSNESRLRFTESLEWSEQAKTSATGLPSVAKELDHVPSPASSSTVTR